MSSPGWSRRASWSRALLIAGALACLLADLACQRQAQSPPPHPRVKPASSGSPGDAPQRRAVKSPLPDFEVDAVSTRSGTASWYDVPDQSLPERRAWPDEMTAASDSLPLNTYARVTRVEGGESVIVRITDKGIHRAHTIIDLCRPAAEALGIVRAGTAKVRIEVLALRNASTDKPVARKDEPVAAKLDAPAATKEDEKRAAESKLSTP